uniref:Uncharacterized protein n=1 Tax=Fagus sylvatica TaxID=28930 RepID=A0A2N9IDL2_FAGSY
MAKTKKSQGKLARYVNTPEAMERFRRHYGVLDDVHLAYRFWENAITGEPGDVIIPLVAIIEGGVRFPIDPLLADFLDYFRISPTQISPNIFRIVNGVAELNRRLGFNLTVHDIIATYFLRTTQHEAFSLRPRDVNNTLVNSLPDTNKEMTDDFLLVRGNWYFPGHRCPTVDGKPEEKKKQVQAHLTDPVALQAVYNSEVKNLAEALANPANQSPPAHDIRDMVGINLKKLLPPTRPQAETSEPVLPLERKRKRKGPAKGEAPRAETSVPLVEEVDVEMVGPFVPGAGPDAPEGLAPVWVPTLEAAGERVRTNATVLRTGGSGSNTATAFCEVARLPGDMTVWCGGSPQTKRSSTIFGSLEIGDRFQRQAAELENALKVATRTFQLRNEAQERLTFQEGWKALFSWPDSDDMPGLPPKESLPYPNAPIGVPEEELSDPLPATNDEASPSYV